MPGSIRALRRRADPVRGGGRIPLVKKRTAGRPQFRTAGTDTLSAQEERIADTVEAAFTAVPQQSLLDSLERRDEAGYALAVLKALSDAQGRLQDALLASFVSSGETSAVDLGRELSRQYRQVGKAETPSPSEVALRFRFNATDPRATAWAQNEAGRLITNMAASEREMFRALVEQSFVESRTMGTTASSIFQQLQTVTPTPSARDFGQSIGANLNGLTTRYERAVMNRVASVADDLAARGITGEKALERMRKEGDKYASKLRRTRSRTIARTERMMAHNQARLLSYQQAIDSGLMSREYSRKVWSTGPFDVCPICVAMSGVEAKVADPFTLPNGAQVQAPPGHPNCRCTLQTRTDTTLYDPPRALGTGEPGDPFRIGRPGLTTEGQIFSTGPLPGGVVAPVVSPTPLEQTNNASLDEVVRIGERQRRAGAANGLSDAADDAVRRYENGSGDYGLVNWRLREPERFEALGRKADKKAAQEVLDGLDEAMELAPDLDQPIMLYRGVTDEGVDALAGLRVGDTFEDAGFVSTSFRRQTAEVFARPRRTGGTGRLVEIEAGPGTRGLMPRAYRNENVREALTGRYDEAEFLLNRGTRFEVVEVSDDVLRVRVVTEPRPTVAPKPPPPAPTPPASSVTANPAGPRADDLASFDSYGLNGSAIRPSDEVAELFEAQYRQYADIDTSDLQFLEQREIEQLADKFEEEDAVTRWLAEADRRAGEAGFSRVADDLLRDWERHQYLVSEQRSPSGLAKFLKDAPKDVPEDEVRAAWLRLEQDFLTKMEEAKVSIQVRPTDLLKILDDGRFKTQFETGTSGGVKDIALRQKEEYRRFGLRRDAPVEQRPIYGHLERPETPNFAVDQYGSARVVLRDEVRERTTYTNGDSLGGGYFANPVNAPATDYIPTAIRRWPPDFGKGFLEAQVHGGVGVDDIAEVIFDTSALTYTEPSKKLLKQLDERGIPYRFVEREGAWKRDTYRTIANPVT